MYFCTHGMAWQSVALIMTRIVVLSWQTNVVFTCYNNAIISNLIYAYNCLMFTSDLKAPLCHVYIHQSPVLLMCTFNAHTSIYTAGLDIFVAMTFFAIGVYP